MKVQELNAYLVPMNNGRMLLLKRRNGFWEFPGGGVEWGESPEQAAVREMKEETGLVPKNVRFLGVTSATFDKAGNEKHAVYVVYACETDSDRHMLSGEHEEARWLLPREAKFLKLGLNAEPVLDMIG